MATLMSIVRTRLVEIAVQQHGLKFEYFFHSQDGMTPILYAAWKGHYEIICLLVEVKADLNLQQKVWFTSITLWPHSKYCMQSPGSRQQTLHAMPGAHASLLTVASHRHELSPNLCLLFAS